MLSFLYSSTLTSIYDYWLPLIAFILQNMKSSFTNILGSSRGFFFLTSENKYCGLLGAGALGQPRGMVQGGRREEGSGWGTRVYLWQIHFDIWQNQYNIVKLKNKIKKKINIVALPYY